MLRITCRACNIAFFPSELYYGLCTKCYDLSLSLKHKPKRKLRRKITLNGKFI